MKKYLVVSALVLCSACDDNDVVLSAVDAGHPSDAGPTDDSTTPSDAATSDAAVEDSGDSSTTTDAGDAGPQSRLLLAIQNMMTSEFVAVNLGTKSIDGRFTFASSYAGLSAGGSDPFVLEQKLDIVAKLDRNQPWMPVSSWNVTMSDSTDGGSSFADPYGVVVAAGNKAYVLRYNRNRIAVIDPSQTADGGAPTGSIDLSSLLQGSDSDGTIEMSAGFYVASRNRVYVLLANIDQYAYDSNLFGFPCSALAPTITAIDTTTDTLVDLGGSGPGGSLVMSGFSPASAIYDAVGDRVIAVQGGCKNPADAGLPTGRAMIEALSLATKASATLLDLNTQAFPGSFAYIDATHAAIGFGYSGQDVYNWDPTQTTLGALIPNAPDCNAFVADNAGNLVGMRTNTSDAGTTKEIVSVRISDGQSTTITSNPFTDDVGYLGGIAIWQQ